MQTNVGAANVRDSQGDVAMLPRSVNGAHVNPVSRDTTVRGCTAKDATFFFGYFGLLFMNAIVVEAPAGKCQSAVGTSACFQFLVERRETAE